MFSQLCITPQYHIICILGHSIMASSGGGGGGCCGPKFVGAKCQILRFFELEQRRVALR